MNNVNHPSKGELRLQVHRKIMKIQFNRKIITKFSVENATLENYFFKYEIRYPLG